MFYPAFLNLAGRSCLVVGAGTVAERKALVLRQSGAAVTLISPNATQAVERLAVSGQLRWHRRHFQSGDTAGHFLVCAATDCAETNTQVFREAREVHDIRLVNVVDVVPECTFAATSVVTNGAVTISVSTGGQSPAMSRRIREYIEAQLGTRSLYDDDLPLREQANFYPVGLLLENRRCAVVSHAGKLNEALAARSRLMQDCGAIVGENLADVSNALVTCVESAALLGKTDPRCLREALDAPEQGDFVTPTIVRDGAMVLGILGDDAAEVEALRAWLADQFQGHGYGAFLDFLGNWRPRVLQHISGQKARQRFFEALIDETLDSETHPCCMAFDNPDCTRACLLNLVRQGMLERAERIAAARLHATA